MRRQGAWLAYLEGQPQQADVEGAVQPACRAERYQTTQRCVWGPAVVSRHLHMKALVTIPAAPPV